MQPHFGYRVSIGRCGQVHAEWTQHGSWHRDIEYMPNYWASTETAEQVLLFGPLSFWEFCILPSVDSIAVLPLAWYCNIRVVLQNYVGCEAWKQLYTLRGQEKMPVIASC